VVRLVDHSGCHDGLGLALGVHDDHRLNNVGGGGWGRDTNLGSNLDSSVVMAVVDHNAGLHNWGFLVSSSDVD